MTSVKAWGKTWTAPPGGNGLRAGLENAAGRQGPQGLVAVPAACVTSGLQNAAPSDAFRCMLCNEPAQWTKKWIGSERVCANCWQKTYAPEPLWLRVLRWVVGRRGPARAP
jgi:hypothetical protein